MKRSDLGFDKIRNWMRVADVTAERLGVLAGGNAQMVPRIFEGRGNVEALRRVLIFVATTSATQYNMNRTIGKKIRLAKANAARLEKYRLRREGLVDADQPKRS